MKRTQSLFIPLRPKENSGLVQDIWCHIMYFYYRLKYRQQFARLQEVALSSNYFILPEKELRFPLYSKIDNTTRSFYLCYKIHKVYWHKQGLLGVRVEYFKFYGWDPCTRLNESNDTVYRYQLTLAYADDYNIPGDDLMCESVNDGVLRILNYRSAAWIRENYGVASETVWVDLDSFRHISFNLPQRGHNKYFFATLKSVMDRLVSPVTRSTINIRTIEVGGIFTASRGTRWYIVVF